MTALAARPTAEQVRQAASRELARLSFVDFLRFCRIQSDDTETLGDIPFEPFGYQLERAEAWAASESEVILKARQLGFSWLLAAYKLWRALMGKWNVGYYSRGEDEALFHLDNRVLYIWKRLPDFLRGKEHRRRDMYVEFPEGGSIRVFPSTESAGIGYTFQLIVADECAFHRYGARNYAAYRPTLSAGGQYIATSTADPELGPSGFFHDLWERTVAGETPYAARFVPWHARPGRDSDWLARERGAFTGMPEHFDAFYPDSPEAAFVGKAGLVYPQFSQRTHVKKAEVPFEKTKYRVAGIDFGGGDPTAVVILGQAADGHIHQYGEFYRRGPVTVAQIAAYLDEWNREASLHRVECDSAEPVAIASLRNMGFPAMAADKRRNEGLPITAHLLANNQLTIEPDCKDSINEFQGYRWVERTDSNSRERYKTSTPVDNHADAMDARRYALMRMEKMAQEHGGKVRLHYRGYERRPRGFKERMRGRR